MKFYYILSLSLFCSFISTNSFAQWEEGNDRITLILSRAHFNNTNPMSQVTEIVFEDSNPLVVTVKFSSRKAMEALRRALVIDKIKNTASEYWPTCKVYCSPLTTPLS